ncbi:hypothetical protein JTB14_022569 [Gonioctena quinquepunctata]|nr:hypothetical protein JTB14_022569 [Gonioctena quinquepunctata]
MKMLTKNVERLINKNKYDVVQFIENKKTLIIKCHVPNSDWSQYDSKIHNFYDSYAKALEHEKKLAACFESEGDQEQRPGKRRIKQKKLLQNMKALSIHLLSFRSYSVKMNSGQVELSKIVLANINI